MRIEQLKCDVCGAIKGDTNHWVVAEITATSFSLSTAVPALSPNVVLDICGQACAAKQAEKWVQMEREKSIAAQQG